MLDELDKLEAEICEHVRNMKKNKLTVSIASELYLVSKEEVRRILKKAGLMDADGKFIEKKRPQAAEVRKDVSDMPRIKPGTFVWTEPRKQKLAAWYQEGTPTEEIAQRLGCTDYQVVEAIGRFNIVRVTMVEPVKPEPADAPVDVPTGDAASTPPEAPEEVANEGDETPSPIPETPPEGKSEPDARFVTALNMLDLFIAQHEDGKTERAFLTLGKLHSLLSIMSAENVCA